MDVAYEYSYQFIYAFSLSLVTLNLALLVRIKYSDTTITHLTRRPYYIALAYLILMNMEYLIALFFNAAVGESIREYGD